MAFINAKGGAQDEINRRNQFYTPPSREESEKQVQRSMEAIDREVQKLKEK